MTISGSGGETPPASESGSGVGRTTGAGPEVSRRKFLSWTIGAIGGTIGVAVAAPLAVYFLSPAWKEAVHLPEVVARTTDIPIGRPVFVSYEQREPDGWVVTTHRKGAWIVTSDGRDFTAFDPRCTHLNCPYSWNEARQVFICPCHDGIFDIEGRVVSGPPPRPLDRLEVVIEDGNIILTGAPAQA